MATKEDIRAPSSEEQSALFGWIQRHQKLLTYGLAGAAIIAVGVWVFVETGRRKQVASAEALEHAQAALESGNFPAASTEFQQVLRSFAGTDAAYQAELGMNLVRLASGQTQIAADALRKFAASNPPPFYAAGAWYLQGGALENLKKYDEAAAAYLASANIAPEAYRKVDGLLAAARAYRLAGKEKEGLDLLRQIVSKYPKDTPGVAEAQVRLAELTKGAM